MTLRDQGKSGKSWLFGLLSHLTRDSRPSAQPNTREEHNASSWFDTRQHHHSEDDGYVSRRSSLSVTGTMDKTDARSRSARSSLRRVHVQCPPPHHRRPSLLSLSVSERRNSQQTTSSSVVSDDQYSSFSSHRRDSDERSILRELWSKARRHHPHYPTFHWPRFSQCRRHSSLGHNYSHSNSDCASTSTKHNPKRFRSADDTPLSVHNESLPSMQHTSSNHEIHHPLSVQRQFSPQNRRHSMASLNSGDHSLVSCPTSPPFSQPVSPNLTALWEDCQLSDDHIDDDIDPFWLDDNTSQCKRWAVKPELVQLAIEDGSLFCSPFKNSASAVGTEKHILQLGCGNAKWAIELALDFPKWIVVSMDDHPGGPSPHRRSLPRNFRYVRCPESILKSLTLIPDNTFDLVHCRFLAFSHPADQYQALIQECWRVCKPGGFVELIEMDMRIYPRRMITAPVIQAFNSEVIHAMETKSLDPRLARRLKDVLANLSHHDNHYPVYHAHYISLPLGLWGGRIGAMFRDDVHDLFEMFQPSVAEYANKPIRTDQELDAAFDVMNDEMERQYSFMNLHYADAQKVERLMC